MFGQALHPADDEILADLQRPSDPPKELEHTVKAARGLSEGSWATTKTILNWRTIVTNIRNVATRQICSCPQHLLWTSSRDDWSSVPPSPKCNNGVHWWQGEGRKEPNIDMAKFKRRGRTGTFGCIHSDKSQEDAGHPKEGWGSDGARLTPTTARQARLALPIATFAIG